MTDTYTLTRRIVRAQCSHSTAEEIAAFYASRFGATWEADGPDLVITLPRGLDWRAVRDVDWIAHVMAFGPIYSES